MTQFFEICYRIAQAFYSQQWLSEWGGRIQRWAQGHDVSAAMGRSVLKWAVIIGVIGLVADMAVYWTRKDQRTRLRHLWGSLTRFFTRSGGAAGDGGR